MPDRKKYIEILSKAAKTVKEFSEDTPIKISLECIEDIMELLKEQEAVEPIVSTAEQRCGNCNKVIEMDGWKACPWCGKMIDWKRWWNKNGTHDNT